MDQPLTSARAVVAAAGLFPLCLILAGCTVHIEPPQPKYEVSHSYTPPATDMGRMCAAQCLTSKDQCLTTQQLSAELAKERCKNDEHARARKEYASYVKSRNDKNKKIDRSEESFYAHARCENVGAAPINCGESYHQCYTTCGGEVVAQSICVANCDLAATSAATAQQPPSAPETTGAIAAR